MGASRGRRGGRGQQTLDALRGITGGVASFGVLRNAGYFLSDLAERFHADAPVSEPARRPELGRGRRWCAGWELEAGLAVLPIDDDGLAVTPLLRDEVLWASADPARTRVADDHCRHRRGAAHPLRRHYGWKDPTRRQLAERAQLGRCAPRADDRGGERGLGAVAGGPRDR